MTKNLGIDEIERLITSHEEPYSYTQKYGRSAGDVVQGTTVYDWHELWCGADDFRVDGLGTVHVEEMFGGEGEGDTAWVVVRVTAEDGTYRLFKKDGGYSSYEGTEFDGRFYEVEPVEKTVTVFEATR